MVRDNASPSWTRVICAFPARFSWRIDLWRGFLGGLTYARFSWRIDLWLGFLGGLTYGSVFLEGRPMTRFSWRIDLWLGFFGGYTSVARISVSACVAGMHALA